MIISILKTGSETLINHPFYIVPSGSSQGKRDGLPPVDGDSEALTSGGLFPPDVQQYPHVVQNYE